MSFNLSGSVARAEANKKLEYSTTGGREVVVTCDFHGFPAEFVLRIPHVDSGGYDPLAGVGLFDTISVEVTI